MGLKEGKAQISNYKILSPCSHNKTYPGKAQISNYKKSVTMFPERNIPKHTRFFFIKIKLDEYRKKVH